MFAKKTYDAKIANINRLKARKHYRTYMKYTPLTGNRVEKTDLQTVTLDRIQSQSKRAYLFLSRA